MLVIRFQRVGRKNLPAYRIVVVEKSRAVKGKFLEILGHFLPKGDNDTFKIDTERLQFWLSKGAQPSDTLARRLKNTGVKDMEKFVRRYTKRKSKNAEEAAAEAPAAPAAPAVPAAA